VLAHDAAPSAPENVSYKKNAQKETPKTKSDRIRTFDASTKQTYDL
jgi:hypothetical protein